MLGLTLFPQFITDNFILRMIVAGFLGAIIGLERDIHGRAAGLRTNLLVSLGAAVFTLISENVAVSFAQSTGDSLLRADPGRIAAQIIAGIGFLGAGAIIKSGFTVHGLTTAACLWVAAAIGMSAGAGYFGMAILTTGIGLFSLVILNQFERVYAKDSYRLLEISTSNSTDISHIIEVVKRKNIKILYLDSERNYNDNKMLIKLTIRLYHKGVTDKLSHVIVEDLEQSGIPIHLIKWRRQ